MIAKLKDLLGFNRKVPLVLFGYDIRRWERPGGGAMYVDEFIKKFLFLDGFAQPFLSHVEVDEEKHTRTMVFDSLLYGPTHIQYKSPVGFLITWPFCVHIWYAFDLGKFDQFDEHVSGSEKVWYFRAGIARWDSGDNKYICGESATIFGKKFTLPFGTWYGPFNLRWD